MKTRTFISLLRLISVLVLPLASSACHSILGSGTGGPSLADRDVEGRGVYRQGLFGSGTGDRGVAGPDMEDRNMERRGLFGSGVGGRGVAGPGLADRSVERRGLFGSGVGISNERASGKYDTLGQFGFSGMPNSSSNTQSNIKSWR